MAKLGCSFLAWCAFWIVCIFGVLVLFQACDKQHDHGPAVEIQAVQFLPAVYGGDVVKSGCRYFECEITYEDGCTERTSKWTMKKPVTLDVDKTTKFTMYYGDLSCKVEIPPRPSARRYPVR